MDRLKVLYSYLADNPEELLHVERKQYGPIADSILAIKGNEDLLELISRKIMPADSFRFSGNIYVIANGGSFSAASVLAIALSNRENVTIVGSETGGGRNGMTALWFDSEVLPHSKLTLRYGLLSGRYPHPVTTKGRGLLPDKLITYDFKDYLEKRDKEMEWILMDVERNRKKENSVTAGGK